jgi:hypothetical protein
VASPERVAGDRDAVEAGLVCACLHEPAPPPGARCVRSWQCRTGRPW